MSHEPPATLPDLPDEDVLSLVKRKTHDLARTQAATIAALMEIERRGLHMRVGMCRTLFQYCTTCLGMSPHEALGRIGTLRVAARYPLIMPLLAEGALTATTVRLVAPLLTPENHESLLNSVRYLSKREVQALVARERLARSGPSVTPLKRRRARSGPSGSPLKRSRTRSGPSEGSR